MAYHVAPKLLSTTHDTYRNPHFDQYDYKFYHPQLFISSVNNYIPDKGTRKFFHDYRRCHVTEQTLERNRESLGLKEPIRPTTISDSPDRVLGRRKFDREAMFPTILNNPLYVLKNRIPDRERDRDKKHMNEVAHHRLQYRDLTGSIQPKAPYFHLPEPSNLTFQAKNPKEHAIGDYPNHHKAAQESTYNLERSAPLAKYMENDVY